MRGSPCGGCPIAENRSTSGRCILRYMARVYIKDPSADFTVASAEPGMAQWVSDVFDPKRAPLVPMSSRFLDSRCSRSIPNPLMLSDIARARGPGFRAKGLHLIVQNASTLHQRALLQSSDGKTQGEKQAQLQPEQQRLCAQHEVRKKIIGGLEHGIARHAFGGQT